MRGGFARNGHQKIWCDEHLLTMSHHCTCYLTWTTNWTKALLQTIGTEPLWSLWTLSRCLVDSPWWIITWLLHEIGERTSNASFFWGDLPTSFGLESLAANMSSSDSSSRRQLACCVSSRAFACCMATCASLSVTGSSAKTWARSKVGRDGVKNPHVSKRDRHVSWPKRSLSIGRCMSIDRCIHITIFVYYNYNQLHVYTQASWSRQNMNQSNNTTTFLLVCECPYSIYSRMT